MTAIEVNFDGLVGPSHNYGDLTDDTLANASAAGRVSRPRDAAFEGLEKMRQLVNAGFVQGVLPPQDRPSRLLFSQLGYGPRIRSDVPRLAGDAPRLLKASYSAASMWAANAATVSPSADTSDHKLHITPANLSTSLHRSLEAAETTSLLRLIFSDPAHFVVHDPLSTHLEFSDQGSANHVRLSADYGQSGVELFVYGRDADDVARQKVARQSKLASLSIARSHGLDPASTVFIRQSDKAIAAGACHNDMVCVGGLDTLVFHEYAFENTAETLAAIGKAAQGRFTLYPVMVKEAEVPLTDALATSFFNAQLLRWPGEEKLVLLAPRSVSTHAATRAYCERLVASGGPIGRVVYVDVNQHMRNNSGTAALRLQVVLTPEELNALHPRVILDNARIDALQDAIAAHYRAELVPADLADPAFAEECRIAREAILEVLGLNVMA